MGRKKVFQEGERQCIKCDAKESDGHPFPPNGNRCKICTKEYNTKYQRERRGGKSRDEKLTLEQRRQHKKEINKRWKENNPEKVKLSDKKQYAENAEKIKKRTSEWQKANLARKRQYNAKRRALKKSQND
jgi:hypothetical protein